MPSLRELQHGLRRALLDGAGAPGLAHILAAIDGGDGEAVERLDVHRNNVFASLTRALAGAFPAVRRLVDERFFAYAAHSFIQRRPPGRPGLAEYGRHFADFLADFPPCRDLVYLADVARLEWLLHESAHAPAAAPLMPDALRAVPPAATPRLRFRFAPSIRYFASRWPVDRIWRANSGGAADAPIDLASGGAWIETRRRAGDVELCSLPPEIFAFREALARGLTLGAAAEAALAVSPRVDLGAALAGLFHDTSLVAFTLSEEVPA